MTASKKEDKRKSSSHQATQEDFPSKRTRSDVFFDGFSVMAEQERRRLREEARRAATSAKSMFAGVISLPLHSHISASAQNPPNSPWLLVDKERLAGMSVQEKLMAGIRAGFSTKPPHYDSTKNEIQRQPGYQSLVPRQRIATVFGMQDILDQTKHLDPSLDPWDVGRRSNTAISSREDTNPGFWRDKLKRKRDQRSKRVVYDRRMRIDATPA